MGLAYRPPGGPLGLVPGEVHLVFSPLAARPALLAAFERDLDDPERGRADRFRTAALRAAFVIGRGLLRSMLAGLTGVQPGRLRFDYGGHGKPRLAGRAGPRFNLSHSGGAALYAFCADRELGVDLERESPLDDHESIARRFFSPAEAAELASLPARERLAAFYRCWTRKEAYLKARGEGLGFPLERFAVSLRPAQPPRLHAPADGRRWSLHDVAPGPGYAAALVAEGAPGAVRAWRFDDAEACVAHFAPVAAHA